MLYDGAGKEKNIESGRLEGNKISRLSNTSSPERTYSVNKNDNETLKQVFTPESSQKLRIIETRINDGSGTGETMVGSSRLFISPWVSAGRRVAVLG